MTTSAHKKTGGSWLSAPEGLSDELQQRIAVRSEKRRASGAWIEADERQVREMSLLFSRDRFATSPEKLELLRALCRTFNVEFKSDVQPSHRKVIGPIIVAIKRAIVPFLTALIGPAFFKQREFNACVVKLLGELSNEKRPS
jgi:hypothetical protein